MTNSDSNNELSHSKDDLMKMFVERTNDDYFREVAKADGYVSQIEHLNVWKGYEIATRSAYLDA